MSSADEALHREEPARRTDSDWEHFHHRADVGVRGFGVSKAAAFEAAGRALTAIVTDLALVRPAERVAIACEAPDDAALFYDWLNALIFEMATRQMLFSRFDVEIEGGRLEGAAWGESVDRARHAPAVEPKGATWTELDVAQGEDGRWRAQCVVDV
jgi:SHS2 domain-containing protein